MTRQIDLEDWYKMNHFCQVCDFCSKDRKEFNIHHISYFPEKTIFICEKCHRIIHRLTSISKINYSEIRLNWHKDGGCHIRSGDVLNDPRYNRFEILKRYEFLWSLKPPKGDARKFYSLKRKEAQ